MLGVASSALKTPVHSPACRRRGLRASFSAMSPLAEELDQHLNQLDPRTAEHVERLVREVLALAADQRAPHTAPRFGALEGKICLAADFDAPLEDFRDYAP